jgi:hypothetical protein
VLKFCHKKNPLNLIEQRVSERVFACCENLFFYSNEHPAPLSEIKSEAGAKVKSIAVNKTFHNG